MERRTRPRVVLADDYLPLHTALQRLLEPECELVGRAATVTELLAEVHTRHPDVAVVDLKLPGSSGLVACRQLKATMPTISIIMLTASDHPGVRQAALEAGASDFVPKHLVGDLLLSAILNAWRRA